MSAEALPRVRITVAFQGEIKHHSLPLTLGRINLKLPESKTKISFCPPDMPIHERFHPLNFSVQREGQLGSKEQEGIRLTVDKAKRFALSVYIFEPGPKTGPKILRPDGTIWQQETVRRSKSEVPITRPTEIEPGGHYRLEIYGDTRCNTTARLVKIEEPLKQKALGYDSQVFQTIYNEIKPLLLKTSKKICGKFDVGLAKKSTLTAINTLNKQLLAELAEMLCTAKSSKNSDLEKKALGIALQTFDRGDIGQLLKDQLKAVYGTEGFKYTNVLASIWNEELVPFIDAVIGLAD